MRKRFFYIGFLCTFIFFACTSKNKVPSSIMQPEKMKSVLWDVMRAQFLANEIVKKDSLASVSAETKVLTQKVFQIHKIAASDFDKSYNWYVQHPELMKLIFDSLYTQKQRNKEDEYQRKQLERPFKKNINK
jgi:hypothetical protein